MPDVPTAPAAPAREMELPTSAARIKIILRDEHSSVLRWIAAALRRTTGIRLHP